MTSKILAGIKKTVIAFLLLVFIMGFFSKSIINLFLPKVMATAAVEGTVERSLNIEGRIEAQKLMKVRLPGDVIVEEYYVKIGDAIEEGTPLFKLDLTYGVKDTGSEAEQLKLALEENELRRKALQNTSYSIELRNISALEHSLQSSMEDLDKQQQLFEAGILSQKELESYREAVARQELDLDIARLNLEEKRADNGAAIRAVENEKARLQLQLKELQGQLDFYEGVNAEGVFTSKYSGIVTSLAEVNEILPRDSELLELADISGEQALLFTADIEEEDVAVVEAAGSVEIPGKNVLDSKYIKVSDIYKLKDQSGYRLEGAITKEQQADFSIGQRLKGVVTQKYVLRGYNKVPKSAVIVFGAYKADSSGTVYLLEVKEGVLGKELVAKQMQVKILAVGDQEVIVSGLEGVQEPQVITNLSYKITDGAKVFLWQ